jgi:hypothetical protein
VPSAADRFSRLEKVAIFLIALGEERTREILADVDVDTLQHLNDAIAGLGDITAEEKAAVMLEFAHFFYEDQMIAPGGPSVSAPPKPTAPPPPKPATVDQPKAPSLDLGGEQEPPPELSDEEQAILQTLDKLRRKLDLGQIDWGKAGYDFGEGFQGPGDDRRR